MVDARSIERDGVVIRFVVVGVGPTVVLQTGGAGDGGMWREHLPHLGGFQVVLLDHRGRGGSGRPAALASHAMSEYVTDVVDVLDSLRVTSAGFVGYSAGAQVGLALAASHPERVAALVGLGATWEPQSPEEVDPMIAMLRVEGMMALVAAVEDDEGIELPEWLRDQFLDTDAEQFALNLEAWQNWQPWTLYDQISCPTLLLAGGLEDPAHVNGVAAQQIPDARAVWLPELGHVSAFLAADTECEVFVPFLRQALAGPVSRS